MKLKQIFRINLLCIWCSAIHPCRVVMNSNWGCHVLHDVLSADRLHVLIYEVGNKRGSTWSISV